MFISFFLLNLIFNYNDNETLKEVINVSNLITLVDINILERTKYLRTLDYFLGIS